MVPDVVAGHSVGEYVAACVAGVFSVEQTMRILEAGNKIGLASNFHGEELVRLNSAEVGHFFQLFFLCIESLIRPMIYFVGSFGFFSFLFFI